MSVRVKIVAALLVGVVAGGVIGAALVGYQTRKMMGSYAQTALVEAATDARQIAAGRADLVFDRKRMAVPLIVLSLEREHANNLTESGRLGALWAAQRYYEETPSEVLPPEVKSVLDRLPPRPPTCCELRSKDEPQNSP